MTIKDCKPGQSARVLSVGGEGALRQHFLDMGVIPGAEVTVVKLAPMGDPMELRIHGYELTLRLEDAENRSGADREAGHPGGPAEALQGSAAPRSWRGRQIPPQRQRRSPPGGHGAELCPGGQPELRQDHAF